MPVFPYQAQNGWHEIWQWKTDVLRSYTGLEQRIRLIEIPTGTIEIQFPIPATERQKVNNFLMQNAKEDWDLPLWTDSLVVNNLEIGDIEIALPPIATLIQNSSRIIIWSSPNKYEIREIASLIDNVLTFTDPLTYNYRKAFVAPLATGFLKTPSDRKTNGYETNVSASFYIKTFPHPPAADPEDTYLYEDLYYEDQILPNQGLIPEEMVSRVDTISNDIANEIFITPWKNVQPSRIFTHYNYSLEDTYNFRGWLMRRSGKYKSFWIPSNEHDFTVKNTGLIESILLCENNNFDLATSPRKYISVLKKDKTRANFRITDSIPISLTELEIYIDEPANLVKEDILSVQFLTLVRLDTDRVELFFMGAGKSNSSLRIAYIDKIIEEEEG